MPSKFRNEFFDEPRDESLIKLGIYAKYLVPWASKVGSTSSDSIIWVVDGFAGPGGYKDKAETPGSPKLILDLAQRTLDTRAKYRIGCVFIEEKLKRWRLLRTLCDHYPDVQLRIIRGDFWDEIEDIVDIVRGQPLLLVIDPFGVMGMDYVKLARLANASNKCDLIVTFFDSAVPRLETQYPEEVARATGARSPDDKSSAETFARNLCNAADFLPAGRFPIRQSFDKAKLYELIVFSRSVHAYRIWNDLVTREWQRLRRSASDPRVASGQTALVGFQDVMGEADATEDQRNAANAILAWSKQEGRRLFQRTDMIDHFVVYRFSDFHLHLRGLLTS